MRKSGWISYLGEKLCDVIISKKSLQASFSLILSRLRMKSPAILILLELPRDCISILNYVMNWLICSLNCLGGLYTLPIIIDFDSPPPYTNMICPSQCSCVLIDRWVSYLNVVSI